MKGVLRDIFQRCLKSTNLTLPMLTLAAILASPMTSMAAPPVQKSKTTTSRSVTTKAADKAAAAHGHRKEAKKEGKKEEVVAKTAAPAKAAVSAKSKHEQKNAARKDLSGVTLKNSVKTLAGGHRVKSSTANKKRKQPIVSSDVFTRPYSKETLAEEAPLFSQLRELENPETRLRLAKSSPMFRPPPTPSNNLREIIADHASTFGINPLLVQAVVAVESGFNARARSPAGALGMMQLTRETANRLGVNQPMDADENIRGGTLYLKMLTEQFDGDTTLALAAYHAGPKTVEDYGGVPPNENTHLFLTRVMLYFNYYLDQE
ncbi:MAG: lytic transglycosylase domain-containing protein [Magnetococcales bacterium]|nr:lytic transglycosylase domain-containing protein [Magnetococcales bacterium]NGZ27527.1 lytic transglycosylase domain-containing protein [Magnetococcales bacterium]